MASVITFGHALLLLSLWTQSSTSAHIAVRGPSTSALPASITTSSGNGIATPTPTQPHMVTNCNEFALVKAGDSCASVAKANSISMEDFALWNPDSGATSDCQGLWANAYACVGVLGSAPTSTPSTPPTTTSAGNGVTTPTPTQTGMVTNCNSFIFVQQGETCDSVARSAGITSANFIKWNPAVGADCSGLWSKTYACVGTF